MYDFVTEQTRICDVELYSKKPVIPSCVVNMMGNMHRILWFDEQVRLGK
jgi:hypothetical protein